MNIVRELRLGNYLEDQKGRLCAVEEIHYNEGFYAPAIRGGMTSLPNKLIPLTDEWLVKFGFEKWHAGQAFIKSYQQQGELIIFTWETAVAEANGIQKGEYYFFFNKIVHALKHVHQLQNLYFALTGQELI